jgi:hypothetical protein
MNVPRITVIHRDGRSDASKDGGSANKGSNEWDHCVRIDEKLSLDKKRKCADIPPREAKRVLCQRG